MYENHWGLACRPFDGYFAPTFYFHSETHEAAHLKLRYMVENGLGLGVLCGAIGTGKTTVAAQLEHELGEASTPIVHLTFPQMPRAEFLAYLAAKLDGNDDHASATRGIDANLQRIECQLRAFGQRGRRPTIVVDDAHLIDDFHVFECLQMLLNFQSDRACSFSLILVGGTILLGRLERIPQLNDRVAVQCIIEPFTAEESCQYIAHRFRAAGSKREIFDNGALDALHALSGGIARRINRLADLALLVGYADQLETIGAGEIHAVAEELPARIAA